MRKRVGSSGGFTLIELLVVIIVVGVLAGIAMWALATTADDARGACATANSRVDHAASIAADLSGSASRTAADYKTSGNPGSC